MPTPSQINLIKMQKSFFYWINKKNTESAQLWWVADRKIDIRACKSTRYKPKWVRKLSSKLSSEQFFFEYLRQKTSLPWLAGAMPKPIGLSLPLHILKKKCASRIKSKEKKFPPSESKNLPTLSRYGSELYILSRNDCTWCIRLESDFKFEF